MDDVRDKCRATDEPDSCELLRDVFLGTRAGVSGGWALDKRILEVRSGVCLGRLEGGRGDVEGIVGGFREGGVSVEARASEVAVDGSETFWKKRKVREGVNLEVRRWDAGVEVADGGGGGEGGEGEWGGAVSSWSEVDTAEWKESCEDDRRDATVSRVDSSGMPPRLACR